MDDLIRAGIGRNGMNPNVIPVADMSIRGLPQNAPMQAAPMPAQAAPQQRQGLLGGFFGPQGRDARSRMAIAIEGLMMNPNQALIGQLQEGIQGRATAAQKNATIEWLRSRGRDDLADAMLAGLPAAEALQMAIKPPEPDMTAGMQEYQMAVSQGYSGTFMDYKRDLAEAQRQQTNINMPGTPTIGTIPPGYELVRDENGVASFRAIGGGPPAIEQAAIAAQKENSVAVADESLALIDSIIGDPALPSITGMIQGRMPAMTQAGTDLSVKIDQLSGQAFLEAFTTLKGAGAITDMEGKVATKAQARLDRIQGTPAYIESLKAMKIIIERGRQRALAGVQARDGDEYSGGTIIDGVTVGEPLE